MNLPPLNIPKSPQTSFNNPIYGQKGEYSLSAHVRVPYFTALMDLKRVTKELKTHEEVTPSLDNTYNLEELFQRTIDSDRVSKEIVEGFLKNPHKLKFFNSLTFVLLPKDRQGHILPEFSDLPNSDPQIPFDGQDEFDKFFSQGKKSVFGGVQFISTEAAALSRLRWDANTVDAVAVDGQHRLKALKLWMHDNNNELAEIAIATRVPVIFLLLHESVGFVTAAGSSSSIKSIAREIFTDLNKNAKEVDLATQIILDDRSLASCCVRSLITESTCSNDVLKLPLSLLRWQDTTNRFDQKYYLNSLVNLHLIVEDLLGLDPLVREAMELKKVYAYIKTANEVVGTKSEASDEYQLRSNDGQTLMEFYKQKFLDENEEPKAPFACLPPQFLPKAVQGFTERYSNWILRILRELRPYARLIDYAESNNLIEGEFSQYHAQPRGHRQQLDIELTAKHGENWQEEVLERHVRYIEKEIKNFGTRNSLGEDWCFKTIFQKAILRFAKDLFLAAPEDQQNKLGKVDDYIQFLNRLHDAEVLRVFAPLPGETYLFWTFISVNFGNNRIRVTSTSEKRIKALIGLIYYSVRLSHYGGRELSVRTRGDETVLTPEELEKIWRTKQAGMEWPSSHTYYSEIIAELAKQAHIIEGITDTSSLSQDRRQQIAKRRFITLLKVGLQPFYGGATNTSQHRSDIRI